MILSLHCAPRRISRHDRFESQAPARFRRRSRSVFRTAGSRAGQVSLEADRGRHAFRRRRRHRHHRAHDDGPRPGRVQDRVRGGEPHRRQRRGGAAVRAREAARRPCHRAHHADAPAHHPAQQRTAQVRGPGAARPRHRGSAGPDGRQEQSVQDRAGLSRRRQGQGAQVGHHPRRQRRPHRLGGRGARRQAPGAGHRAVPRRRRHRDQPGGRQHRLRARQLRRGGVAGEIRRRARARDLRRQAPQRPGQRAHGQGNRRAGEPVDGARLRHGEGSAR